MISQFISAFATPTVEERDRKFAQLIHVFNQNRYSDIALRSGWIRDKADGLYTMMRGIEDYSTCLLRIFVQPDFDQLIEARMREKGVHYDAIQTADAIMSVTVYIWRQLHDAIYGEAPDFRDPKAVFDDKINPTATELKALHHLYKVGLSNGPEILYELGQVRILINLGKLASGNMTIPA